MALVSKIVIKSLGVLKSKLWGGENEFRLLTPKSL